MYLRICWCCFPMLPHLPWTLLFLSLGGQCSERLVDVCTSPRVCFSCFDCVSLTFVSPLFKASGLGRERWGEEPGCRVWVCVCVSVRVLVTFFRLADSFIWHTSCRRQHHKVLGGQGAAAGGSCRCMLRYSSDAERGSLTGGYHARSGL